MILTNLGFFSAAWADTSMPEVYFEHADGRIIKADEENSFTLTCLDKGKFKAEKGNPYFEAHVDMEDGRDNWINQWVRSDGSYTGFDVRTLPVNVYKEDPAFGTQDNLLGNFNIKCVSSEIEELKVFMDGKEITDEEPGVIKGTEKKYVTLKGRQKGKTDWVDIEFDQSAELKEKKGSGVVIDGKGEIYIYNPETEEAVFEVVMHDGSCRKEFKVKHEYVAVEDFRLLYNKKVYIRNWDSFGEHFVGIGLGKEDESRETSYAEVFTPANASDKILVWNDLTPEVATHRYEFNNGMLPKKAGIAKFEVYSKDIPDNKQYVEVEFAYEKPVLSASTKEKRMTITEGDFRAIEVKTVPYDATEQRFNWSYSKEGIADITDSVGGDPVKVTHKLTGITPGTVTVTGTPVDNTAGAEPVKFEVTVNANGSAVPDAKPVAFDGRNHGLNALKSDRYVYGSEWNLFTILRCGTDIPSELKEEYTESAFKTVKTAPRLKLTDYARIQLALSAMNVTEKNNSNVKEITKALTDKNKIKSSTVNGPVFALLALDSVGTEIPAGGMSRKDIIQVILQHQNKDGSFALMKGEAGDVDVTAMAVQSLAPYYLKNDSDVKKAVDKALVYLAGTMDATAGYNGNSCSSAQVLTAITSLQIDPVNDKRFSRGRNNLVTELMKFKVSGGFKTFDYGKTADGFANTQVTYALESYLRFVEGRTSLYDCRDIVNEEDKIAAALKKLKKEAVKEIEEYRSPESYKKDQQKRMKRILEVSTEVINKAKSGDEIRAAVKNYKAQADIILAGTLPGKKAELERDASLTDYERMAEIGLNRGVNSLTGKSHTVLGDEAALVSLIKAGAVSGEMVEKYMKDAEAKYYGDDVLFNYQELLVYGLSGKTRENSEFVDAIMEMHIATYDNAFDENIKDMTDTMIAMSLVGDGIDGNEWSLREFIEYFGESYAVDGGSGGFDYECYAGEGSPLGTAYALQGLAYSYKAGNEEAVAYVDKAVSYLKSQIGDDASFGDVLTDANVVIALTAIGIDSCKGDFVKGDKTLISSLYNAETEKSEDLKTLAAATDAYNSYLLFLGSGKGFYEKDGTRPATKEDKDFIKSVEAAEAVRDRIGKIGEVKAEDDKMLKEIRDEYVNLPDGVKVFVSNIGMLESAERKVELLKNPPEVKEPEKKPVPEKKPGSEGSREEVKVTEARKAAIEKIKSVDGVKYSEEALKAIMKKLPEDVTDLKCVLKKTEEGVNAKQKESIKNSRALAVYSIELIATRANGSTIKISDFDGGKVTITVPFEKPENIDVEVHRVEEDGTITLMNSSYEKGKLSWITDGHSYYMVSKKGTASAAGQSASPKTGDNVHLLLWILIFAVAASTLVVSYKNK